MLTFDDLILKCACSHAAVLPGKKIYIYIYIFLYTYVDVSKNSGTPKSSVSIGFSIINHPFWGTPIFGNTHISFLLNEFKVPKVLRNHFDLSK